MYFHTKTKEPISDYEYHRLPFRERDAYTFENKVVTARINEKYLEKSADKYPATSRKEPKPNPSTVRRETRKVTKEATEAVEDLKKELNLE